MRTLTAAQRKILEAPSGHHSFCRARVSNDGGTTWVNLSSLRGRDFFLGANWISTVDSTMDEAHVLLRREVEGWSLAPGMASSPLNQDSGTDYPLLQKGFTRVQIQTATLPLENEPTSGDWRTAFLGVLVEPRDDGSGVLDLFCRDMGEYLMRTFIEEERQYGTDSGVALEVVIAQLLSDNYLAPGYVRWAPSTTFPLNAHGIPTAGRATGYWYLGDFNSGEHTGTTEPTWPVPPGTYPLGVGDGTTTWFLDDPLDNLYMVRRPADPGFDVGPYLQRSEPLLTALETLAMQIGWACRYRFPADGESGDANTSYLTLFSPDRDAMASQYTLLPVHVRSAPTVGGSTDFIRNAVEIPYLDRADLDPAGNPKPKRVLVDRSYSDPGVAALAQDSEDKYGRRFMRYAPGAGANIDTQAEAERLGVSALLDLCEPMAEVEVEVPYLYWVQLHDVLTLPADGFLYDEEQVLAVTQVVHKAELGRAMVTTLSLRGRPMVARMQWLHRQAQPGIAGSLPLEGPNAVENLELTETTGGFTLAFTRPTRGRRVKDVELHLSSSSGFTPGDSTFYQKVDGDTVTVTDLTPGLTRYAKIVTRDERGNRGATSSEVTLTTRYVEPRTLQPAIAYGALPLNSDFEAQNTVGGPPDAWSVTAGNWGTDVTSTTDAYTGGRAMLFSNATGELTAQLIAARGGVRYFIDIITKRVNNVVPDLNIDWLDASFSVLSTENPVITLSEISTSYARYFTIFTSDAATRYARVRLAATGASIYIDSVAFGPAENVTENPYVLTALEYLNALTAYTTGGRQGVSYQRDPAGRVNIEGHVSGGSNVQIFLLPTEYRPPALREFIVATNIGTARVSVTSTGAVTIDTGSVGATWVCLNGVSFSTS